jgi:hypothetical protein
MFFEPDQPRKSLIGLSGHMWAYIFWSANFGFSDIGKRAHYQRSAVPRQFKATPRKVVRLFKATRKVGRLGSGWSASALNDFGVHLDADIACSTQDRAMPLNQKFFLLFPLKLVRTI